MGPRARCEDILGSHIEMVLGQKNRKMGVQTGRTGPDFRFCVCLCVCARARPHTHPHPHPHTHTVLCIYTTTTNKSGKRMRTAKVPLRQDGFSLLLRLPPQCFVIWRAFLAICLTKTRQLQQLCMFVASSLPSREDH